MHLLHHAITLHIQKLPTYIITQQHHQRHTTTGGSQVRIESCPRPLCTSIQLVNAGVQEAVLKAGLLQVAIMYRSLAADALIDSDSPLSMHAEPSTAQAELAQQGPNRTQ
jgi:hypothetical protein